MAQGKIPEDVAKGLDGILRSTVPSVSHGTVLAPKK